MKLTIKDMVCPRCEEAVTEILTSLELTPVKVTLGHVEIAEEVLTKSMKSKLAAKLLARGFELLDTPQDATIEIIKKAVVKHVRSPHECRLKLSGCLEEQLHASYDTLSRLFSAHEGMTIEKYHVAQRVEWVKELMSRGNLTVSEIAHITGYSSLSHLSRQFKAVTGQTPTQYLSGERSGK